MEPYVLAEPQIPAGFLPFNSHLHSEAESLFDITDLTTSISVTLPYTDTAHTALRHLHTVSMHGHKIQIAIPATLFQSDSFIPYIRRHSTSDVYQAKDILRFCDGAPVPGHQKFHVLTLVSNQCSSDIACAASLAQHLSFVDLLCTMPVRVGGHKAKALVDTASNHSMITKDFLDSCGISFTATPNVTLGVSGTPAPSLGKLTLDATIGRRAMPVLFTVVESLPSAAAHWHDPNSALLGLDVISAVNMKIDFDSDPKRIKITLPHSRSGPKRHRKEWHHIVHISQPFIAAAETSAAVGSPAHRASYSAAASISSHPINAHSARPLQAATSALPSASPPHPHSPDVSTSHKELHALLSQAARGKTPLFAVHVRPCGADTCMASSKGTGYLAQQQAPAPSPQDTASIPDCVQHVMNSHKQPGGTLGPAPPNSTALGFEMNIDLLPGARPKAARQYRLTPVEHLELETQIQKLLDMGWIQPSISPWASSILFAPKPGGKLRLCVDYRYLNENTIRNTYPLPRIDALLDKLIGHKYFSALDLAAGYHQIRIAETSRSTTAFRTPDGLYEWTVTPFGLTNAPSVFQQAMHSVLRGLIGKICLAYLDDIIVIGKTAEEHAANLDQVLKRLSEHKFYCNVDKCQFALTEIKYLGHLVTASTVKPDPYKVSVLSSWPLSDLQASANNIRSFLGLAGYFRRFVPLFHILAAPLLERIKDKHSTQQWTSHCTRAFTEIKRALLNTTGMCHPDLNRPFHLYTDASDYAYGAVLMQEHPDGLKPVAWGGRFDDDMRRSARLNHASPVSSHPVSIQSNGTASPQTPTAINSSLRPVAWAGRKMNKSEVNHATFEKELGAIVFAARHWRCYLETNQPVFIHSDHNPLKYLQTQQKLNHKQARWVESLSRINWHITYVPGDKNVVADAVSRATHLQDGTIQLHDGFPISCVSMHQPHSDYSYPAVSLIFLLVRRTPTRHPAASASAPPSYGLERTQTAMP